MVGQLSVFLSSPPPIYVDYYSNQVKRQYVLLHVLIISNYFSKAIFNDQTSPAVPQIMLRAKSLSLVIYFLVRIFKNKYVHQCFLFCQLLEDFIFWCAFPVDYCHNNQQKQFYFKILVNDFRSVC